MKHGKKYVDSAKQIDKTKVYDSAEALGLSCTNAKAKFIAESIKKVWFAASQVSNCVRCSSMLVLTIKKSSSIW